jgi:ADP-ribose 1''-phosphate phosphatase
MSIVYKKGSLFDAPKDSILVHSCNAQGVWGSGIAKEFKIRFPESYEMYHLGCLDEDATGLGILLPEENGYRVGCLITSKNYANKKDSIDVILNNTEAALQMFFTTQLLGSKDEIHSCKFNSGLFGVPWEKTEKILLDIMKEIGYTKEWTVWEL